jgi:antitoxin component of MazEF toxin-antitoxin module
MLKGEISRGDEILVDIENNALVFSHVGKRELRMDKRTEEPKEESSEDQIEEEENQE